MYKLMFSLALGSFFTAAQYAFDYYSSVYWHQTNIIGGVIMALVAYVILKRMA